MELEKDYYLRFTTNHKQLLRLASDNSLSIHSIDEKNKHDLQFKDAIVFSQHSFTEARNGLKEELLAMGTKKGSILLIDYKTKKVRSSLSAHSGSVDCISYDVQNNLLYSTGQDKIIKRWDLAAMQVSSQYKIEKKGMSGPVIVLPFLDENHVLYSLQNSIYLLNFATKSVEAKYTSQCTAFTTLSTLTGSKTFLAFAKNESICLFMNDSDIALANIDVSTLKLQYVEYFKRTKGRFVILGHNASNIHLWYVHINKGAATIEAKTDIKLKTPFIERIQFVDGDQIIVAAKRDESVAFNIFSLVAKDGDQKDAKQIETDLLSFYNTTLKKSASKVSGSKTPVVSESYIIGEAEHFATKNGAIEEELADGQTNNRDSQSLIQMFNFEKTGDKDQVGGDLRNESLSVVLLQALHNNDQELLEFCFQNDDELVLETTIKQVLNSKIPALVEKLIAYLNSGTVKSKNLLLWLKITLKHHNFLIMQNPKLIDLLRPLVSILRKRTENIGNLMKLRGKIDLLLNAQESYNSSKKQSKSLTVNKKPLIVYEEGDDKAFENYVEVKTRANKKKGASKSKKDMVDEEEEEEDEEKDFSSSVSVSDEDDVNQNFDTYLQATADDLREDNEDYEEGSSDAEFIEFDR